MKRIRMRWFLVPKFLYVLIIGIVILVSGMAVTFMMLPKPPLSVIEEAQSAISTARKANAALYASDDLSLAETHLEEARSALHRENKRLPFLRDYRQTIHLSLQAKQEAARRCGKFLTEIVNVHRFKVQGSGLTFEPGTT